MKWMSVRNNGIYLYAAVVYCNVSVNWLTVSRELVTSGNVMVTVEVE